MKLKDYIAPQCESVFMQADTSFLLIASAGGEGEAGKIGDPDDDYIYVL